MCDQVDEGKEPPAAETIGECDGKCVMAGFGETYHCKRCGWHEEQSMPIV